MIDPRVDRLSYCFKTTSTVFRRIGIMYACFLAVDIVALSIVLVVIMFLDGWEVVVLSFTIHWSKNLNYTDCSYLPYTWLGLVSSLLVSCSNPISLHTWDLCYLTYFKHLRYADCHYTGNIWCKKDRWDSLWLSRIFWPRISRNASKFVLLLSTIF